MPPVYRPVGVTLQWERGWPHLGGRRAQSGDMVEITITRKPQPDPPMSYGLIRADKILALARRRLPPELRAVPDALLVQTLQQVGISGQRKRGDHLPRRETPYLESVAGYLVVQGQRVLFQAATADYEEDLGEGLRLVDLNPDRRPLLKQVHLRNRIPNNRHTCYGPILALDPCRSPCAWRPGYAARRSTQVVFWRLEGGRDHLEKLNTGWRILADRAGRIPASVAKATMQAWEAKEPVALLECSGR